jgi:hypothetical protein
MMEIISLTGIGGVAVSFMLIFSRALRRDAPKPRIQLMRKRVMRRTNSASEKKATTSLSRAA